MKVLTMKLENPALQRAYDRFMTQRNVRQIFGQHGYAVSSGRHPELATAYSEAGRNAKGVLYYYIVRYCSSCKRGTVIDMVTAVPDYMPNAHKLGIRRMKPWRMECNGS